MKKIRSILIIIIIALILVNSYYYFKLDVEDIINKSPIEVDKILVKVLVKEGRNFETNIIITNNGDKGLNLKAETINLGLLSVSQPEFFLDYGQSINLGLNFDTTKDIIKQVPGIYVGELIISGDGERIELPVILGIESEETLFSVNLNMPLETRRLSKGDSGLVGINVYNLKKIGPVNVLMSYFVSDTKGNKIITESEEIIVEDKVSFTKTIKIPKNIQRGDYIYGAEARYGTSMGVAANTFKVEAIEEVMLNKAQVCLNKPFCSIPVVFIFTIIILIIGFIFHRQIKRIKNEKTIKKFFKDTFLEKKRKSLKKLTEERIELENKRKKKEEENKRNEEERKKKEWTEIKKLSEKRRQHTLALKRKEENKKKNKELLQKRIRTFKKKTYDFLHKIGIIKTEEDKREQERQNQEFKEIKENEKKKGVEEKKKQASNKKRQLTLESKKNEEIKHEREVQEEEDKKLEEKRNLEEIGRKSKLKKDRSRARGKLVFNLFHSIGLVKTQKEIIEAGKRRERERELKVQEQKMLEQEKRKNEEKRTIEKKNPEETKNISDFINTLGMFKSKEQKQSEKKKKLIGGIMGGVITKKPTINYYLLKEVKRLRKQGNDYQSIRRILIYKDQDIVDIGDVIAYNKDSDKERGIEFEE